jgi:transcriptional regulator with XRE-family HTH domain
VDIHARLKWAREKRGYASAREAADALGIRYSTYAGHESGIRGIKRDALRRYAKFFGVSPAWLEFGTDGDGAPSGVNEQKSTADNTGLSSRGATKIQFVASSIIEPARFGGFIQAGIWVDPTVALEKAITGEGVAAISGKWGGLPQVYYVAKDNSADQLRISDGDHVLCVPYERARGGQLHDKDIVVIERVRSGGAFERTVKQITLKNSTCSLVARSSEPRYPSISINAQTMTEKDGTIVRVVGLAIAVVTPLPTD